MNKMFTNKTAAEQVPPPIAAPTPAAIGMPMVFALTDRRASPSPPSLQRSAPRSPPSLQLPAAPSVTTPTVTTGFQASGRPAKPPVLMQDEAKSIIDRELTSGKYEQANDPTYVVNLVFYGEPCTGKTTMKNRILELHSLTRENGIILINGNDYKDRIPCAQFRQELREAITRWQEKYQSFSDEQLPSMVSALVIDEAHNLHPDLLESLQDFTECFQLTAAGKFARNHWNFILGNWKTEHLVSMGRGNANQVGVFSRIRSGLVEFRQFKNSEEILQILRNKSQFLDKKIPDEWLYYLASQFPEKDLRYLIRQLGYPRPISPKPVNTIGPMMPQRLSPTATAAAKTESAQLSATKNPLMGDAKHIIPPSQPRTANPQKDQKTPANGKRLDTLSILKQILAKQWGRQPNQKTTDQENNAMTLINKFAVNQEGLLEIVRDTNWQSKVPQLQGLNNEALAKKMHNDPIIKNQLFNEVTNSLEIARPLWDDTKFKLDWTGRTLRRCLCMLFNLPAWSDPKAIKESRANLTSRHWETGLLYVTDSGGYLRARKPEEIKSQSEAESGHSSASDSDSDNSSCQRHRNKKSSTKKRKRPHKEELKCKPRKRSKH